jgi:hypothetical protein
MLIMGIAHLLLTIYTVQPAILANPAQEARLYSSFGWGLGLYFLFLTAWLFHFWRHFSRT